MSAILKSGMQMASRVSVKTLEKPETLQKYCRSLSYLHRMQPLTTRGSALTLHNHTTTLLRAASAKRFNSITSSTDGHVIPDSVVKLTQDEYRHLADQTLETISCDLEDFFEDNDVMSADVEENAGIVTINTGEGVYVINKQPPNKQIWLSSPLSGPKRFDYLDGQWVSLRDNEKLYDILNAEMKQLFDGFEFTDQF